MIIIFRHIISKGFNAITLFPFIIVRNSSLKKDFVLIHHEKIHLQQQKELGILFFFIFYGLEFIVRLFQYKNRFLAYQNISFEREAYHHEKDFSYLKKRKYGSFTKYL